MSPFHLMLCTSHALHKLVSVVCGLYCIYHNLPVAIEITTSASDEQPMAHVN